jgi:hypothetical protein
MIRLIGLIRWGLMPLTGLTQRAAEAGLMDLLMEIGGGVAGAEGATLVMVIRLAMLHLQIAGINATNSMTPAFLPAARIFNAVLPATSK